ncbi:class I lanthipeptide [Pseudomonas shirazensis]
MKKQNPNNKLAFNKVAVTELNERQLQDVNGGTVVTSIVYSIIDLTLI